MTNRVFLELEVELEALGGHAQHAGGSGRDLGSNAVTGQNDQMHRSSPSVAAAIIRHGMRPPPSLRAYTACVHLPVARGGGVVHADQW